jgi:hypothetical protein
MSADKYWLRVTQNFYCTYLLTYLLTPWSRVLLEKLTVNFAASQEIPHIYGTRNFLTVPTRARHLSLFWANSIQSPRPPPTSWKSILYYSPIYVLVSIMASFPQAFPPTPCALLSLPPYAPHALPISFVSVLPPAQYWVRSTDHSAPRYAAFSIFLSPRNSYVICVDDISFLTVGN